MAFLGSRLGIKKKNKFRVFVFKQSIFLLATCAPVVDLQFISEIYRYPDVQKDVAEAAIASCHNHLWYLSEELVLALFDEGLSHFWKTLMVKKMKNTPRIISTSFTPTKPKMPEFDSTCIPNLIDLIGPRSWLIFNLLRCSNKQIEWMQFPSMDWELFEDYRDLKAFFCGLEVINDSTERGVKMISDFKDIVDNEEQQQYLLQVIEISSRNKLKWKKRRLVQNINLYL